ncbi:hypothetical protein OCL88_01740 [Paenarthrobacter sp. PAE-2]|nr:hypothetical protein [Paenarthrobacter sp. PAE-2]MCW3765182.1 hypothetical protein [Paenarthrobacter sp. PAE-2]
MGGKVDPDAIYIEFRLQAPTTCTYSIPYGLHNGITHITVQPDIIVRQEYYIPARVECLQPGISSTC